jgi:hypothetical protein
MAVTIAFKKPKSSCERNEPLCHLNREKAERTATRGCSKAAPEGAAISCKQRLVPAARTRVLRRREPFGQCLSGGA